MKRLWCVVLLGGLLGPNAAWADKVFPPFKPTQSRVVIDNLNDYPDQAFYLVAAGWISPDEKAIRHPPGQPWRLTPGEARPTLGYTRIVRDWMLVAVPRERADSVNWQTLAPGTPGVLHSNRVPLTPPEPVLLFWPM